MLVRACAEQKTVVNMVCEVPRWTNAKMEIDVAAPLNPIIQDSKKGTATSTSFLTISHTFLRSISIPPTHAPCDVLYLVPKLVGC